MDLCNTNYIKSLLERHGFNFSKSLGQNFLTASWVPDRIAEESGINFGNGVLEIGPGIGCLTQSLSAKAGKVVAVELDKRLLPILSETVGELPNVDVINGDIMKVDLKNVVDTYFSGLTPVVCANLPYNITTPVLTKLISSRLFNSITVMVQLEVAKRICALPGSKDYGAFSLFIAFHSQPELLFQVPPSCFEPMPKVTSAVVNIAIEKDSYPDCDEALFFKIVRGAFNQRRKTLQNSLTSTFSGQLDKNAISSALNSIGIDPGLRGEALKLADYLAICKCFKSLLIEKQL